MADIKSGENTVDASPASSGPLGAPQSSSTETSKGDESQQSLADVIKKSVASNEDDKGEDTEKALTVEEQDELSRSKNEQDNEEEKKDPAEKKKEGEEDEGKEDPESEEESEEQEEESEEEVKDRSAEGRIKALVAEKNELQSQYEASKTKVTEYDQLNSYCSEHGISGEQFREAMEVQALLNNNPEEALKRLLPLVETLQGYVGNRLPDDLQAKVDAEKLGIEDAREIAKLRAGRQIETRNAELQQRRMQAERQRDMEGQMLSSFNNWDSAKKAKDPDYSPKKKESDPDGKWEFVKDKILAMLNDTRMENGRSVPINRIKSPQDMIAVAEKAYAAVHASFQSRSRKPATRKTLPSNGSSTVSTKKTVENAGSMREAIELGLKGRF